MSDQRACFRSGCLDPRWIGRRGSAYCVKHDRFSGMRARAKTDGKVVPSWAELEALVPADMVCCGCRRTMNWQRTERGSTAITLQHDRSGRLRMICLACNARHAQMPHDSFYALPHDRKWCPGCNGFKAIDQFDPASRTRRWHNVKSRCIACMTGSYRRLNVLTVLAVRDMAGEGVSQERIARWMGIAQCTVSRVVNGKWKADEHLRWMES